MKLIVALALASIVVAIVAAILWAMCAAAGVADEEAGRK